MSDTISLEWIGKTLRTIQSEQRNARTESELLRAQVGRLEARMAGLLTRDDLLEVLRLLLERIGNFEALVEARLDVLASQIGGKPAP